MRLEWYYLPPWKDSDDEYQPGSIDGFTQAMKRWKFSIEGGGLWDYEQERD